MAIIDSKVAAEAQRQAREYAQRNDSAANQDWQQPPPAYEEAPVAASTSSQPAQSGCDTPQAHLHAPPLSTSSQRGGSSASTLSDENTPLLTRQQEQRLRKKMHRRLKAKQVLGIIMAFFSLIFVGLLLFDLFGSEEHEDILPFPIASDGEPIENPVWSPIIKTDPDLWPYPDIPFYSSFTNFSFDAFKAHFIHEYSNGAISTGQLNIVNAGPYPEDTWKRKNRGVFYDRIFVQVEARFTKVELRDAIRVNKMRINPMKEGLGIYGTKSKQTPSRSYVSFHIYVFLPSESQRTGRGLLEEDGSSYIPELDINVDNLRIGLEGMQDPLENGSGHITFGNLKTRQSDNSMTGIRGLRANNSIDIHLQNGPVIDAKAKGQTVSMQAPRISIHVVNGPILLTKLVARDLINLTATNGAIDITDIAIAKSIKTKQVTGSTSGWYRAEDLEIQTSASDGNVTVDLTSDLFSSGKLWKGYNGVDQRLQCQQRRVKLQTDLGDLEVHFQNHDSQTQLHSSVIVNTGSIKVIHDRSFEGTFEIANTLGSVYVNYPDSKGQIESLYNLSQSNKALVQAETKAFVITSDRRNGAGRMIKGRTWWPQRHSWEDKDEFCSSYSNSTLNVGRMEMYF